MIRNNNIHVIMAGPRLDVKGGISSFAGYCLRSDLSKKVEIVYCPTTVDTNKILKIYFFIRSLILFFIRLLSDRKVKIIHIFTGSGGSFYRKAIILFISRLFRKKTILHIEASGFDIFYDRGYVFKKFCIRKVLDISNSIIVLSRTWFSEISRMTRNTNIKIIPNCVDASDFRYIYLKRRNGNLNVLTLGRIGRRKGTYDILDIVPMVISEVPNAKFYIAGDGDVEDIKRICRMKKIEKNIILLGWIDRDKVIDMLKNSCIFLLPSYNEGLPVAMLEAMASGLPVVSTKVGGIPEVIEDKINGFLVDPGEKQGLANRIITLLKDRGLRERMGRNNIDKIYSAFNLNHLSEGLYTEYIELLHKKADFNKARL